MFRLGLGAASIGTASSGWADFYSASESPAPSRFRDFLWAGYHFRVDDEFAEIVQYDVGGE